MYLLTFTIVGRGERNSCIGALLRFAGVRRGRSDAAGVPEVCSFARSAFQ